MFDLWPNLQQWWRRRKAGPVPPIPVLSSPEVSRRRYSGPQLPRDFHGGAQTADVMPGGLLDDPGPPRWPASPRPIRVLVFDVVVVPDPLPALYSTFMDSMFADVLGLSDEPEVIYRNCGPDILRFAALPWAPRDLGGPFWFGGHQYAVPGDGYSGHRGCRH